MKSMFMEPKPPTEPPADEKPVWSPPEGGGHTEPSEHEIGKLDPEEEAWNRGERP